MHGISAETAAWLARLRYDQLPADVVTATRRRILDTIGNALAAAAQDYGRAMHASALAIGGAGLSSILGFGDRTSAAAAALANGAMAGALSFDDTHNATIVHVTASVLGAALAMGEEVDAEGEAFVTALAGASELTCRIGMAAPREFHKRGFHPTGIIGAFGAAHAASRLLGLDLEQATHALGIAGSFAAGLGEGLRDGSQTPLLHCGWAAQSGVAAALLARHGHSGPAAVLEGPYGLFRSHVQDPSYAFAFDQITAGLGSRWESRTISLKPYPCAHVLHAFLDALLQLHRDGLRAAHISRITCPIADYMIGVVCEPRAEKYAPRTDTQARGSLYYCLAEALYRGDLDAQSFQRRYLEHPEILALARKIDYVVDATAPPGGQFKGWVIVETLDGRRLERIEPHNRGSLEHPLSDTAFLRKFRGNAVTLLSAERIAALEAAAAEFSGPGAVRRLAAAACA